MANKLREFQTSDADFDSDGKITSADIDIIQDIYNKKSNDQSISETYQNKLETVFSAVYGDNTIKLELSRIEELLNYSIEHCTADDDNFNDDDMNKIDLLFQKFAYWISMNPDITSPSLIKYFATMFNGGTTYYLMPNVEVTTQWLINIFSHSESKKTSDKITGFNYYEPWTAYSKGNSDADAIYILSVEKPLRDLYEEIFNIYDVMSVSKTLTVLKHDSKSDPVLYVTVREDSSITHTYTWYKYVSGNWQEINGANDSEYRIPNSDLNIETSEFFTTLYYKVKLQDSASQLNPREYTLFVYLLDFDNENTLWGDINGDGVVNILDIYRLKKLFNLRIGDTNFDNIVDATDASAILSTYSKLSTTDDNSQANYMNIIYERVRDSTSPKIMKVAEYFGEDLLMPAMACIMDYSHAKDKTDDYALYGWPTINAEDASLVMVDYAQFMSSKGKTEMPNYTLGNSNYGISVLSETMARGLVMLDRESTRRKELISAHLYKILQAIKNKDVKLT